MFRPHVETRPTSQVAGHMFDVQWVPESAEKKKHLYLKSRSRMSNSHETVGWVGGLTRRELASVVVCTLATSNQEESLHFG